MNFARRATLTEDNFAISYYDTVTGESYDWNETHMMIAGSTFKLPLNLYYYELENAGEIAPMRSLPRAVRRSIGATT